MAATYYVSAAGNNGNNGTTTGTPWLDLTNVNTHTYVAGDTIAFRGGDTFNGSINSPGASGTNGNPITFTSYGTGSATLHATGGNAINMYNIGYITVSNLNMTGPGTDNYGGVSAYVDNGTYNGVTISGCTVSGFKNGIVFQADAYNHGFNNVSISNCQLTGNFGSGLYCGGGVSGATYSHNTWTVSGVTSYNNPGNASNTGAATGYGILLSSLKTATVSHCTAYGNGTATAYSGGGPTGFMTTLCDSIIITNCLAYSNSSGSTGIDGAGFDLDISTYNSIIEYCLAYSNEGAGILVWGAGSAGNGNTVRYNTMWGNGQTNEGDLYIGGATELVAYNNTIVSRDNGAVHPPCVKIFSAAFSGKSNSGSAVYNNILCAAAGNLVATDGAVTAAQILFGGNDYYPIGSGILWNGTTYTTITSWRAAVTGQEVVAGVNRGITTDPALQARATAPTTTNPSAVGATVSGLRLGGKACLQTGIPYSTLSIGSPGTVDYWGGPVDASAPNIGADAGRLNYFFAAW